MRHIWLTLLAVISLSSPARAQTWVRGQQVTIEPKNVALLVDETTTLKAYARTSAGLPVLRPGISWTSRDTSVVSVQSRTNDVADVAARNEGQSWVVASWKTRSGTFVDSVLVSVSPRELGSLPWVRGQQLLLLPKVNPETFVLKERDSLFLQGLARTSQGIPISNPLVHFSVDSTVATIRRVTNATAMLVVTDTPTKGPVTVYARWNTRSGVFQDSTQFFVEPTPPAVDVAIENVVISQAIQTDINAVPLVDNRRALLRVFLRASQENTPTPQVRVRLLNNGTVFKTVYVTGRSVVSTTQTPAQIASTWNLVLDSADVVPGLQVLVDLDNHLDADNSNNVWPRTAQPFNVAVTRPLPIHIRFVPIFHARSNRTAVVNESNVESYLRELRLMFPLNELTYDIRQTFTSNADTLKSNDSNGAWLTTLSEINSLRFTETAPANTYFAGIVNPSYGGGVAGLAYVPGRASLTWDKSGTRGRVFAHELGHNFSRRHVAACGAGNTDRNYPHVGGRIGGYGWNAMTGVIVDTVLTDIMGYCSSQWISDYTWNGSLQFRGFRTANAEAVTVTEDIIQVTGRILNDSVVVDPTFRYTAESTVEDVPSRFRIKLFDRDNGLVSDVPVVPTEIDHGTELHFGLRIPLDKATQLDRLEIHFDDRVIARVHDTPQPTDMVTALKVGEDIYRINWSGNWKSALVIDILTGQALGTLRSSGDVILSNNGSVVVILSGGLTNQLHLINLPK